MTAPIVLRQRNAAAALPAERVSMQTMARAYGSTTHGTMLHLMAAPCLDLGQRVEHALGFNVNGPD